MIDYGTQEEMKPDHLCRADLCGGERVDGSELCSMHKLYADARTEREAKAKADAQALEDVAFLDAAACRYGTRLDIPAKIPGFDPGDADHIHFVLMPIGADARRAAVEWLKKNRPESIAAPGQPKWLNAWAVANGRASRI